MTPKKRITIVIPDAGPLISLAMGDALDLLLAIRPGVRLVVTDIAHFETTIFAHRFADGARIARFIAEHADSIEVTPTTIGQFALPAIREQLRHDPNASWPKDLGELSITGFIMNSKRFNPGEPTLVLIEDDWFANNAYAVPGNVHLLSTSSFLDGLERHHIIDSADRIKQLIRMQRPGFRSDFLLDVEAEKIPEGTDWERSFRPP